jgi:hypothetical protein
MQVARRPGTPPSNISNRQKKFLANGLARIGMRSYREYMRSDLWAGTKRRYYDSCLPQSCMVCQAPNFDLHHKTYARLGEEKLTDLAPLCRLHHETLHADKLALWTGPALLREKELEERLVRSRVFAP